MPEHLAVTNLLLIFVAGGLGSVARYLGTALTQPLAGRFFPLGTLCVNVVGCFLIGFLVPAFSSRISIREDYRVALIAGFIGGFTTFSAFGFESFSLLSERRIGAAGLNIVLSVGLGLAAVWLGQRAAQT